MTRPTDIPENVWDSAFAIAEANEPSTETLARAILAAKAEERGACAALATNFATTSNTRDLHLAMQEAASADTAERIAAAIRKRGEG